MLPSRSVWDETTNEPLLSCSRVLAVVVRPTEVGLRVERESYIKKIYKL